RQDPGGRGLADYQRRRGDFRPRQLQSAAESLANNARVVGIVTGFCACNDTIAAAETDGPPGALFLAKSLAELGIDVHLISDSYGLPLLQAGCDLWNLPRDWILEFPIEHASSDERARDKETDAFVTWYFSRGPGRSLTHLVAVERAGPSHTITSLKAQDRNGPPPIEDFDALVPRDRRDLCHNMSGRPIHDRTANTHRLFEWIEQRGLPIHTIGVGDGGNEIGMGSIPWESLRAAVAVGPGGRVACRIGADWTLTAGVSNWGAYALAASVCGLRGRLDALASLNCDAQRLLIETLVREAGAVDGITMRREPTVDGLPLGEYLRILAGIRAAFGLPP
ncbi:MAG: DUF4392 domain-containing protein, partial [Planctomycetales bacterium]